MSLSCQERPKFLAIFLIATPKIVYYNEIANRGGGRLFLQMINKMAWKAVWPLLAREGESKQGNYIYYEKSVSRHVHGVLFLVLDR